MKRPSLEIDLRKVLSGVSDLAGMPATEIVKAINKDSQKARRFCILVLRRKGHSPEQIAAAFSMPSPEPRKSHAKPDDDALRAVADVCQVPTEAIIEGARTPMVCRARFMLAALIKERKPWLCHADLSSMMGKKDHTTAINRLKRAAHLMEADETFRAAMDKARQALEK